MLPELLLKALPVVTLEGRALALESCFLVLLVRGAISCDQDRMWRKNFTGPFFRLVTLLVHVDLDCVSSSSGGPEIPMPILPERRD